MQSNLPMFFAGVSSVDGYCSHLGEIYKPDSDWRAYIIKGGAGMGKSTLMKRVAHAMQEAGVDIWYAPCPGDPDSVDAVVFPKIKACLMDATSPHIVNPVYPEVSEIMINLGDQCDHAKIAGYKNEIISVCKQSSLLYSRATRYIAATASLLADSYRVAMEATDMSKAAAYGARLAARVMPRKGRRGEESERFLSAVTPKGHIFLGDTLKTMCDRLVIIEDEYGAAGRAIMSAVRMTALEHGYDIITCMCPFAPNEKPEHIIVPELRIGFTTQNQYLKISSDERRIHARRFTSAAVLSEYRQRLSFNRRAVRELINGTVTTLAEAKAMHDSIEGYYIACMDFEAVKKRTDKIIADMLSRIKA